MSDWLLLDVRLRWEIELILVKVLLWKFSVVIFFRFFSLWILLVVWWVMVSGRLVLFMFRLLLWMCSNLILFCFMFIFNWVVWVLRLFLSSFFIIEVGCFIILLVAIWLVNCVVRWIILFKGKFILLLLGVVY